MAKAKAGGPRLRRETAFLRETVLKHSKGTVRLFRNTVGAGFIGPHVYPGDGMVVITRPTRVKFGLGSGTSDLIGWRSRVIRPDDVGYRIAQFVAIEGKSASGVATQQQIDFLRLVWDSGGCAGVARTDEDVVAILKGGPFDAK